MVLGKASRRMSEVVSSASRVLVVGSSHDVLSLASGLDEEFEVVFAGNRDDVVAGATEQGLEARYTAFDDGRDLRALDLDVDAALVAADRDPTNMLVTQQLRTSLGVSNVVVRVNDPTREDAFAALGVETICPSDVLTPEIKGLIQDSV
jgi:Trk K+ transport system NAD-binding subunit